jgi:penicillin amidase
VPREDWLTRSVRDVPALMRMKYVSLLLLSLSLLVATRPGAADVAPAQSRFVVKGLQAEAEILVDTWGVPHIYASAPVDAFFAQGWNAARDRLWQIDLWRRSGLGELSAVLGGGYVAQDRAVRLFSYRGDLNKEWAAYGTDARVSTEAFVAGINAYIAAAKVDATLMPPEFKLAGYEPSFWKAEDVVRVRNHGIAQNAFLETQRALMACKDGPETLQVLPTIAPAWQPIVPQGLDLCGIPANVLDQYFLSRAPVDFTARGLPGAARNPVEAMQFVEKAVSINQGSNNWVIAPSRTTTGRPILANDPHRAHQVPSLRYIAHLNAPGLNFIGAGEPALPGVSLGHNEHIAIGGTVFWIASEDLYVYETNPRDPNQYRYGNGWEHMRVEHESVAVQGERNRDVELKFTRHGPVVLEEPKNHRAYAVRATWLDVGGAPYMAGLRYLRAKSVGEVASALKHWGEPGINHVVADTAGKIGWFPAGLTPIRSNTDGLLPLPGNGRYEWGGYLDRDLLPSEVDPKRGYIATANEMNLPKDYPYAQRPVSFFWVDNSRIDRINEVLGDLPKSSIEDSERLQNDYVSLPARRLMRLLATMKSPDQTLHELLAWLGTWDANVLAQSPQAALYGVWISRHLVPAVIDKVAGSMPPRLRGVVSTIHIAEIIGLLEQPGPRLGADPLQARDDLILSTLAAAAEETRTLLGPDRSKWQWGQLHQTLLDHPLSSLADEPQRTHMKLGPVPKDGDANVLGVAEYDPRTFRTTTGASFRMVLDVGRWDESVAINAPGQAGSWTTPHYGDLFSAWREGRYFPLLYTRAAIERATRHKISLVPCATPSD